MQQLPFEVGKAYLIRTVTHYWLGQVRDIKGSFLCLESPSAWVADTGRYSKATKLRANPEDLAEVELVESPAFVNTDAIVDATEWSGPLASSSK
jgi:hypothetical protein